MTRVAIALAVVCVTGVALAQAPAQIGESAQRMIGSWEFSNCVNLFPLVRDVAAWKFPDNDLLYLLDAKGKSLVEFSEVEDGIFEAPTPGVGVLFLQNAAAAGAPPKPPEQVTGDWAIVRKGGSPVCVLTLGMNKASDGFGVVVKPGCEAAIARLNFTQWLIDSDQLMLVPSRGNPWRFEEIDPSTWRRVPESADQITLVRQ